MYPSSLPNIDLQVLPTFPAHVQGTGPITVSKSGLTYTFGADFRQIMHTTALTPVADYHVLLQNVQTGSFHRASLADIYANFDPPDGSIGNAKLADNIVTDAKVYTPTSAGDPDAVKATKISFIQAGTDVVYRTVQDKLREFVSVKDFGAVGDGVTDDTAAFQKAADSPHPWVIVPDGIYLVDTVIVTRKKRWELGPSAIVKMRSPYAGVRAVFDFRSSAAGSSFRGGIIDGNRDELGPYFTDPDWFWSGLRALNVNDFTIEDVTARNCVTFGFWLQGNRMLGRNLRVVASGKGSELKRITDGHFSGLDFTDIGNEGLNVYQHVNEWRNLENVSIEGVSVKDFHPDTTGREPTPEAIDISQCRRVSLSNVLIDGFYGTSISGRSLGICADAVDSLSISGLHVIGYTSGVQIQSCTSVSVTNFHLDGSYTGNSGRGIEVVNSGIIQAPDGTLSLNARTPHSPRHVSFSNGTVKRFDVGAIVRGSRIKFSQTEIFNNVTDGLQLKRSPGNGFFGGEASEVGAVDIDSTVSIFNNGGIGVALDEWTDFRANGARIENNGQDAALPATQRCGVVSVAGTGAKGRVSLENCRLGDTQNFTLSDAASFIPGDTDADNRKAIFFNNLSGIYEGQWVRLVGAAGGGSDIVAKVVSLDLTQMAVVVETLAPATFSEVGNIYTLTGTFDTVGQELTGTGSQLLSEGLPFAILKANGEYRVLRRVDSDTDGVLEEPFSSDLSGATVQIIKIDVAGIPSQQYGERWTNLPAGTIFTRFNRYDGVVQAPVLASTNTVFAPGSEVYLGTGPAGTALNTGGITSSIIGGLPDGWVPVAWRTEVVDTITGTDATLNYEFRDTTGVRKSLAANTNYTVGAKTNGEINSDPFVGTGALAIRLTGGSSNVASGGSVRAEIICRVPRLSEFT